MIKGIAENINDSVADWAVSRMHWACAEPRLGPLNYFKKFIF